jgi:hypothetical protein
LKKDAASLALDFDPEPGVHHGSRWADGFSDRLALAYQDENREAFGALDVLYSWTYCAGDHQWIYLDFPRFGGHGLIRRRASPLS